MVVEVGDDDVVAGRDGAEVRPGQLVGAVAAPTKPPDQRAGRLEDEHAARLVVDDDDAAPAVDRDALRAEQTAGADAADELAGRVEDGHAPVVVVGDEQLAVCVERDARRPL